MARNKFNVDEELQASFNFEHLKRLFKYMSPYKGKVFLTAFIMLFASAAGVLAPFLVKRAIDVEIPQKDVKGLVTIAGLFLLTLLVSAVCLKLRIRLITQVGQKIIYTIRDDLFCHLQKLPFTFYDSRPHGKILVRVVNYVNAVNNLLSNGLINIITDLFSLIGIIAFMIIIDVRLTAICLASLPILMTVVFFIKNKQRKTWQTLSSKQSNLNAYVHESICGIKVTQSFSREKTNLDIFRDVSNNYRKSWLKATFYQHILWPIIENISVLGTIALFIVGIMWLDNGVSTGTLIAFTGYIGMFWIPITNIGNFYNMIINTMAYLERIFEMMDEELVVENLPGAYDMHKIDGRVKFENVVFDYGDGEIILKGVSFKANPGDNIAIVGPTGSGKTTIINLISRFYNVDQGKVLVDGVNVKDVTLESLRKQMGVMLQDTFIFSGTIMDNIRYGKLDATDEEVIEAAKAVKAHDFIIKMEEGYETYVNERGSRLSVGQRQLIAFARALLADPRILILDEATSSIDTETEMALQKGLAKLLEGRTSFVIAHRLSTIRNATRIIYIDGGKIVEEGNHEELMRLRGKYHKLYTSQNKFMKAV